MELSEGRRRKFAISDNSLRLFTFLGFTFYGFVCHFLGFRQRFQASFKFWEIQTCKKYFISRLDYLRKKSENNGYNKTLSGEDDFKRLQKKSQAYFTITNVYDEDFFSFSFSKNIFSIKREF